MILNIFASLLVIIWSLSVICFFLLWWGNSQKERARERWFMKSNKHDNYNAESATKNAAA